MDGEERTKKFTRRRTLQGLGLGALLVSVSVGGTKPDSGSRTATETPEQNETQDGTNAKPKFEFLVIATSVEDDHGDLSYEEFDGPVDKSTHEKFNVAFSTPNVFHDDKARVAIDVMLYHEQNNYVAENKCYRASMNEDKGDPGIGWYSEFSTAVLERGQYTAIVTITDVQLKRSSTEQVGFELV